MEVKERPPLPDVWPPPLASYAWRGAAKIDYGRRILRGQTMDEQEAIHEGYIYDYIRTKEDKS